MTQGDAVQFTADCEKEPVGNAQPQQANPASSDAANPTPLTEAICVLGYN